jgi:ABC-type branched-chain amino acid transport systems, periplasmic component
MRLKPTIVGAVAAVAILAGCSTAPAADAGAPATLEVGGMFSMTGSLASYGEQQSRGIELAFEEINAAGGAAGTELKLNIEDIKSEPATAVTALNKLASVDKVPFTFISTSSVIAASAPVGDRAGVVMMNAGATAPTLAGLSDFLFSSVPLENYHIENEAKYAFEELGIRTIGILHTDEALGQSDADAMEAAWEAIGGEVVGRQSAEYTTTTFRPQLTLLDAQKPDAIYMAVGGQQIAIALNQYTELGADAVVLGTSFWTVPEALEAARGISKGVVFSTQRWNPEDPGTDEAKAFVDAFTAKYGVAPLGNSATYYVAAHILGDVIASLNESGTAITGDSIRERMHEIGTFSTIFGDLTFAEDGTSIMPLSLLEIRDGQFVSID